ncbi:unnamed protein product [Urochloa decumbens]|uniref:Protein kinase domain-containing protein n=1 Tax=Urochloa decumbens TaxID=240449 RepID=A0ABC9E5H0_9POAL
MLLLLLSSLVFMMQFQVKTVALPGSSCPQRCGDVDIVYPFGIGAGCAMEGFVLSCNKTAGGRTGGRNNVTFYGEIPVLNISLLYGQVRMKNSISSLCYNRSTGELDIANTDSMSWDLWTMSMQSKVTFTFSVQLNKFTVVGINTLAYMTDDSSQSSQVFGCVSESSPYVDHDYNYTAPPARDGVCDGVGCCQVAFTSNMSYYYVNFDEGYNTTSLYTNRTKTDNAKYCGYAVLVANDAFEFRTTYLDTTIFMEENAGGVPVILNWAVGNETCAVAKERRDSYVCRRNKSDCIDSKNGPGYLCNCSKGYHAITCIYVIHERRKLSNIKQKYFQQHGGMLLLQEISLKQGTAFSIFTEADLIDATDKFDDKNILGRGGHGTVYKCTLKDGSLIAVKRCVLLTSEQQKKEFGQEMLILSQISHKNIVKLLGCCLEVEVPMLVYEFIPNGTLFQFIHGDNGSHNIPFSTRIRIALESALALAYLYSSASPPILHGICGYLDPEYMQTCLLTDKSVVYNFWVVLLELITGKMAFNLEGPEDERSLSLHFLNAMKEDRLMDVIDDRIKIESDTGFVEEVFFFLSLFVEEVAELARQCLEMIGERRPAMRDVADKLGKVMQHPWVPPQHEPEEMESLLGESSVASLEMISTGNFSMEKRVVQGLMESGRCAMEGFVLSCNKTAGGPNMTFYGEVPVLNISLLDSQVRMKNGILSMCYNWSTGKLDIAYTDSISLDFWTMSTQSNVTFTFSEQLNKFTVVGINTLAYMTDDSSPSSQVFGCVSESSPYVYYDNNYTYRAPPAQDGVCDGAGCCQVAFTSNMSSYYVNFDEGYNITSLYTNRTKTDNAKYCGYAVLVEDAAFRFHTTYLNTTIFLEENAGSVPVILNWAVGNETCAVAKEKKGSYACRSNKSICIDLKNGPGYICKCSEGYDGNPYLPDGCKDINECEVKVPPPCPGHCINMPGNFSCPNQKPSSGFSQSGTTVLVVGSSIGVVLVVIATTCTYVIRERRKLANIKQKYFQQHGGMLLLQEISLKQGTAFSIFTEADLIDATDKFDDKNILGRGGHGTVYKGKLKDGSLIAVKRRGMLVYEFIPNGTVFQYIHGDNGSHNIPFSTRIRIALESALALAYLHSWASPPILHGDVKSSNILLDENYAAKTCLLTDKSDVYSFGVVLLELLTGKMAFNLEGPEDERSLSLRFLNAMKEDRLMDIIDDRIKIESDTAFVEEVAELARQCLEMIGERRPAMRDVADKLDRLGKVMQHPWVPAQHEPEEMESLLGESSVASLEMISTRNFSMEKRVAQGLLESGR